MSTGALIALAAAVSLCAALAGAQSAGGNVVTKRERVHPELVDSTWKPRVDAAWRVAKANHWRQAYALFDSLHREQPDAVDPRVGLGYSARGEQRYSIARRWYRAALAVDPGNKEAQDQLDGIKWNRPAEIELQERGDAQDGGAKISHHASFVLPVAPGISINGSYGLFGAGDPLASFFARTNDTTGRGDVESGGVVWTPNANFTLDTYFERWAIDQTLTEYAYVDASSPIADRLTGHLTMRQTFAGQASPVLGTGVDWAFAEAHVLTAEFYHTTYSTNIEAQAQARLFEQYTPNPRWDARAGLVYDIDPHFSAQTVATSLAYYLSPIFGLRAELTGRLNSNSQFGVAIAVVRRW